MAIVRTSPIIPMTVGEYKNAAFRHLNTCKLLWRYIGIPTSSNLKTLPEDEILQNIFYLTGYVAECAIKYAYLVGCHSLNDSDEESHWCSLPAKVNVRKHLTFVSTSPRDKAWSEYIIQSLCASASSSSISMYLQIIGNVVATPVPHIASIEEDMQASWEPSIRYHYATNGLPLPSNKANILAFYQATKQLMINLNI